MTQGACETGVGLTVQVQAHFRRGNRGRKHLEPGAAPEAPAVDHGRVPRLARLMALAIRFDRLVREGNVSDFADLARLGHVTRARMTQIMNLLNLAPDIQEAILALPRTVAGQDPISERQVRRVAAEADWDRQRRTWHPLTAESRPSERFGSDELPSRRTASPLDHGTREQYCGGRR